VPGQRPAAPTVPALLHAAVVALLPPAVDFTGSAPGEHGRSEPEGAPVRALQLPGGRFLLPAADQEAGLDGAAVRVLPAGVPGVVRERVHPAAAVHLRERGVQLSAVRVSEVSDEVQDNGAEAVLPADSELLLQGDEVPEAGVQPEAAPGAVPEPDDRKLLDGRGGRVRVAGAGAARAGPGDRPVLEAHQHKQERGVRAADNVEDVLSAVHAVQNGHLPGVLPAAPVRPASAEHRLKHEEHKTPVQRLHIHVRLLVRI